MALQRRYPGITLDVLSETRSPSLSKREADIAIRMVRFEGRGQRFESSSVRQEFLKNNILA